MYLEILCVNLEKDKADVDDLHLIHVYIITLRWIMEQVLMIFLKSYSSRNLIITYIIRTYTAYCDGW